jgi:hypothetical protein
MQQLRPGGECDDARTLRDDDDEHDDALLVRSRLRQRQLAGGGLCSGGENSFLSFSFKRSVSRDLPFDDINVN